MTRAIAGILLIGLSLGACDKGPPATAPQVTVRPDRTYAKDCAAPLTGWHRSPGEIPEILAHYIIALDATGQITWSGAEVDMAQLRRYAREVDASPGNDMRFIANPAASCSKVQAIRSLMNELPICNERRDCIEGTEGMPPPPPDASGLR